MKPKPPKAFLRGIRLVVLDVDGVLTDGRIVLDQEGKESRFFDVRDGYGIRKAAGLGIRFALISGKDSAVVTHRAKELGIDEVHQGVREKLGVFTAVVAKAGLTAHEVCCVGDDEPDLPMLAAAGFSVAPHDAVAAVRRAVHYVTKADGGRGAVREVVDMILASRHRTGDASGR
jgi:3-deoxy-D-manno-octulosonate 8-phosphate phosphatase (KDO 8-P phosphatase)